MKPFCSRPPLFSRSHFLLQIKSTRRRAQRCLLRENRHAHAPRRSLCAPTRRHAGSCRMARCSARAHRTPAGLAARRVLAAAAALRAGQTRRQREAFWFGGRLAPLPHAPRSVVWLGARIARRSARRRCAAPRLARVHHRGGAATSGCTHTNQPAAPRAHAHAAARTANASQHEAVLLLFQNTLLAKR